MITLFQEKKVHHNQDDGSRETPKLDPCWKLQPVIYLHGKYGVEVRIFSLNRQHSLLGQNFSWIKQVSDEFEQQRNRNSRRSGRRTSVKIGEGFRMPIKGKSKTAKKRTCQLFTKNSTHWEKEFHWHWTREIFFLRIWGIEESNVSSSWFTTNASKRRLSGSFFWEWRKIFRIHSHNLFMGLTIDDKHVWQQHEEQKGDFCRALQGHSGRNLIDPSFQDNVVIPSNFFQHIYHIGCAFILHSIIIFGWIPGGQGSSKRQTVFFLLVDLMDKSHKDSKVIDLNVSRHAQYMHNAWKKHQDAVCWVDINLAIRKGLTFYQTRSNAIIYHETLPGYCIPKNVRKKFYAKKFRCHLDFRQRSHWNTTGREN